MRQGRTPTTSYPSSGFIILDAPPALAESEATAPHWTTPATETLPSHSAMAEGLEVMVREEPRRTTVTEGEEGEAATAVAAAAAEAGMGAGAGRGAMSMTGKAMVTAMSRTSAWERDDTLVMSAGAVAVMVVVVAVVVVDFHWAVTASSALASQ